MSNKILIIGGTGKTGKRVAERLNKLNLPIRIGSRNASPAFDWEKPETWSNALKEIHSVYITYQPDLAVPAAVDCIRNFTQSTKEAGVKKLVLLSGRGETEAQACENIIKNSSLDWTIIRVSWFMQNYSENFLLDSILSGNLVLPKTNALEPFIDAEDIADVVVAALTDNKHSQKIYELTGPQLLSFEKTASLISTATNRLISYQEVNMEEYTAMLRSYSIPEDFIWLVKYLFTETLDGRNESITNDIELVLGRKPTSFENYVNRTVQTGVWNIQN